MITITPDTIMRTVIDTGSDDLYAWADVLEEQGDPRAAGLRLVSDRRHQPLRGEDLYGWVSKAHLSDLRPEAIDPAAHSRLRGFPVGLAGDGDLYRCYGYRSVAFLALAAALTENKS